MITKNQILALGMISILIWSCAKEKQIATNSNSGQPQIPSPLSGKEFLFENLTWQIYGSAGSGFDESYLQTAARPDLFPDITWPLNAIIFIKVDTSNNWIEVKHHQHYDFSIPLQYVYDIYSNKLTILVWPSNESLTGKKATIKTKFF
jgi:hypothetical protein